MRKTRINPTSEKTRKRNAIWRRVCLERAEQLREKYGYIICEWSGEPILALSSVGEYMNDGWGHHIDGNRNNTDILNCYIVKYKYHSRITDENIKVGQEDFQGRPIIKEE